jgi:hypothetical protein
MLFRKSTVLALAAAAMTALANRMSLAHDIEAIHVHESHIAQGLTLAMLAAVACGAGLVFAVLWRRRAKR